MKHIQIKLVAVGLLAVIAFSAPAVQALTETDIANVKKAVANVPAPELAAKASDLVGKALAADREAVATTAVRAIVTKNAAVAASVVASIAATAPEVAPAAAATAAEIAPDQAEKIAKAAALAAPSAASKIAAAVAKTNARHAARIARAVMSALPKSAGKIADAVIAAVPSAKAQVESFSQIFAGSPVTGGDVTQDTLRINGGAFPGEAPVAYGSAPGSDPTRP